MPDQKKKYIGRFAPSPTGPLHFGSIVAALSSYLDAKHNDGKWLVRMDDLDVLREQKGANELILSALEVLGLHWDESVVYQSRRLEAYKDAEQQLKSKDLLYRCYCSRKLVAGKPYSGTCREVPYENDRQFAIRILTEEDIFVLYDLIQTEFSQNLYSEVGDFIIKRADGLFSYHLAVAVDDAYQNITHVVRGADLMDSTPRQIYLQQLLGFETPVYAHLPVATSRPGEKISKQHGAEDVNLNNHPVSILFDTLVFLGQKPETELLKSSVEEIIQWGISNWSLKKIPGTFEIMAPTKFLT